MYDFNRGLAIDNERVSGSSIAKCSFVNYSTAYNQRSHSHDLPQLWYCADGEYVHNVNGVEYHCGAGDMIIVPPSFVHCFRVCSENGADLYMLSLSHRMLPELVARDALYCVQLLYSVGRKNTSGEEVGCCFSFSEEKREFVKSFFNKLLQCAILPESAVVRLICEFFEAEEFGNEKIVSAKMREEIEGKILPITKALEYITNHYTEKLSMEDIARSVAMSRTTFFTP